MMTVTEYAFKQFPNHYVTTPDGDPPLRSHTAVAHVLGDDAIEPMMSALRAEHPGEDVVLVRVEATEPTVINVGNEDPEAVVDLPMKRVASSASLVGALIGVAIGVVVGLVVGPLAGLVAGLFGAVLGGWIGGMVGGGGRFAGERAWAMPQASDQPVVLVAALLDDERSAVAAARTMSRFQADDVRILDERGGWHAPNTFR